MSDIITFDFELVMQNKAEVNYTVNYIHFCEVRICIPNVPALLPSLHQYSGDLTAHYFYIKREFVSSSGTWDNTYHVQQHITERAEHQDQTLRPSFDKDTL